MEDWDFDERQYAGEEYLDPASVEAYDEKAPFDPSAEIELLREHGLNTDDVVLDVGTGTGVLAAALVPHCRQVIALDVSKAMLEAATARADAAGVDNIDFVTSGIVSYDHRGPPVDVAYTRNVFHHLPDFWKLEGLKSIARALRPGGLLRFRDLVYDFDPWKSAEALTTWREEAVEAGWDVDEIDRHVEAEFSTYGGLMETMFESDGFELIDTTYREGRYGYYTCRWPGRATDATA